MPRLFYQTRVENMQHARSTFTLSRWGAFESFSKVEGEKREDKTQADLLCFRDGYF